MKNIVLNTLTAFLFCLSQVESYPTDCLVVQEQWPQDQSGDLIDSVPVLSTDTTEDMKMSMEIITTCVDNLNMVAGLQFQLVSDITDGELNLPSIGTLDGTCDSLNLYGGKINKIKVSQSKSQINAIKFFNEEGSELSYGELDSDNTYKWTFSDELELIGLYG